MKLKSYLFILIVSLAFASCHKCVTCVPYHYNLGKFGALDNGTQSIKLCDQLDISNYENTTNFEDAGGDTVRFICK